MRGTWKFAFMAASFAVGLVLGVAARAVAYPEPGYGRTEVTETSRAPATETAPTAVVAQVFVRNPRPFGAPFVRPFARPFGRPPVVVVRPRPFFSPFGPVVDDFFFDDDLFFEEERFFFDDDDAFRPRFFGDRFFGEEDDD